MSFFKGLIDSLGEILSVPSSTDNPPHPSSKLDPTMDSTVITNERTAFKLKGYFELAKEEIAKAFRAEEWGLIEDAIAHYNNAERILIEAKDTRPPSYVSPSELEKVKSYHQKIAKWQGHVSERLQVLSRRSVGTSSTSKTTVAQAKTAAQPKTAAISSKSSTVRKELVQKPSFPGRNNLTTRNQMNNAGSPKPVQQSSGAYDTKLVEMIETAIVDKSPSVRWEDVAGLEKAKQSLLEMVILPTKRKDLFTGLRRPARGPWDESPSKEMTNVLKGCTQLSSYTVEAATSYHESPMQFSLKVEIGNYDSFYDKGLFFSPAEIDSITSTKVANENEASRRLKSEFLVQFDGVTSNFGDLVIVIGATNKPQELDDAVFRRLARRRSPALDDESNAVPRFTRCFLKNFKKRNIALGHVRDDVTQTTYSYSI